MTRTIKRNAFVGAIAGMAACAALVLGADSAQAMPAGDPGAWMIIYGPTTAGCDDCGWLEPQSDRLLIDAARETGWF